MKYRLTTLLLVVFVISIGLLSIGHTAEDLLSDKPLTPEYERAKQVYTRLAWATYLRSAKRLSEAKKAYQVVLSESDESAFVHTAYARLSLDLQDIRTAQNECQRAIELAPEKPSAYFLLGQILIQRLGQSNAKLEEAIAAFQKVVELDHDHIEGHRYLGELSALKKDYLTAIAAFKELTRIAPYAAPYHMRLADIYDRSGKKDEALATYERVIKIDRDIPQVHQTLVALYVEQYQGYHHRIYDQREDHPMLLADAVSVLEKIIASYTDLRRLSLPADQSDYDLGIQDSQARLGSVYLFFQQTEKAVDAFQRVLEANPNQVDANFGIGLAYQEAGNFDKAEFHLRKIITLVPDNTRAYEALGLLYIVFGQGDRAIETWSEILKVKDANQPEAHYWLGLAYQDNGNFDAAERHLQKAIELDPNREEAYNALGYMYAEHNTNLDEAVKLIKKALEKSPHRPEYLDSLGWAYFKQGKIDEALEELEKADHYMPGNTEIKDHLGEAYLKKGFTDKAIATWKQAAQIDPQNEKILEKLNRVQRQ